MTLHDEIVHLRVLVRELRDEVGYVEPEPYGLERLRRVTAELSAKYAPPPRLTVLPGGREDETP